VKAPASSGAFALLTIGKPHHYRRRNFNGCAMIELSYSEATAIATKAARGAGHEWGVAEDAAMAVHWLCAAGFDGLGHLYRALDQINTLRCPISAGLRISDFARITTGPIDQGTVFLAISEPIFVLPFVVNAAKIREQNLTLFADDHAVSIDAFGNVSGMDCLNGLEQASIKITPTQSQTGCKKLEPKPRVFTQIETFDALTALAHRTYVPATDASRDAGAGAGTSDND
jgi:hypothetical protein